MKTLLIDPDFQTVLIPLSESEKEQLEESIKNEGCREPLIIWEDTIIDGHNRYEICSRKKYDFKIINKKFNSKNEAIQWIIKNQLARRNLSIWQKVKIAEKSRPIIEAIAAGNQSKAGGDKKSQKSKSLSQKSDKAIEAYHTDIEIGNMSGVSRDTVHKVHVILQHANEHPDIIADLDNNEISINKAYNLINPKNPTPAKTKKPYHPSSNKSDSKPTYMSKADMLRSGGKLEYIVEVVLALIKADDAKEFEKVENYITELKITFQQ